MRPIGRLAGGALLAGAIALLVALAPAPAATEAYLLCEAGPPARFADALVCARVAPPGCRCASPANAWAMFYWLLAPVALVLAAALALRASLAGAIVALLVTILASGGVALAWLGSIDAGARPRSELLDLVIIALVAAIVFALVLLAEPALKRRKNAAASTRA